MGNSGIKAGIRFAVGKEPREVVTRLASGGVELTPNEDLSVRLERERIDAAIRIIIDPRIKAPVQSPIRIEPAEVFPRITAERCEFASHENIPVGLHRQAVYRLVRSRMEVGVQGTIRVEPANEVARLPSQGRKTTRSH